MALFSVKRGIPTSITVLRTTILNELLNLSVVLLDNLPHNAITLSQFVINFKKCTTRYIVQLVR